MLPEGAVVFRVAYEELFRGSGKGGEGVHSLGEKGVVFPLAEVETQGGHLPPLALGKETAGDGTGGENAVRRADYENSLRRAGADSVGGSRRNAVQRLGESTDFGAHKRQLEEP